jgi:collagen type II alpha
VFIVQHIGQGQIKGPDPLGDEPPRIFSKEITEQERRELLLKVYENLKSSYQKLVKPDGEKNSPAKTCRDLFVAYPNKLSGELLCTHSLYWNCLIFYKCHYYQRLNTQ